MEVDPAPPANRQEPLVLGRYNVKELFRCLFDITTALEKYQRKVDIHDPTSYLMEPLYDLLVPWKVDRHQSLLKDLCVQLEQHIRFLLFVRTETASTLLLELMAVAISLIYIEPLCPVMLFMMRKISKVPDRYLSAVADVPNAYAMADLTVKRQIWSSRTTRAIFNSMLKDLVNDYLLDRHAAALSKKPYFGMVPSTRFQHATVVELCHLVGDDSRLFRHTIRYMDQKFADTLNVNIASFRSEFIMAVRDTEMCNTGLFNPVLILISIMSRCIEGQDIIGYHQNAIEYLLERINPDTEYSAAIALIDPHVVDFLAKTIIQFIHVIHFPEQEAASARKTSMAFRLMLFGLRAISADPLPTVNFCGILIRTISWQMTINLLLEQHLRDIPDPLVYANEASRNNTPSKDKLIQCMKAHPLGATLGMQYCLHVIEQYGKFGVLRVIPLLDECNCDIVYTEHTINQLITLLLPLDFSCDIFCSFVFDRFFGRGLQYPNVRYQLMGLVTSVNSQLTPARLRSLMRALEPDENESPVTIEKYEQLTQVVDRTQRRREARARAQQRRAQQRKAQQRRARQ